VTSRHRTGDDAAAYYRDVLLDRVGASLGLVQHLLRLAVLVHRDRHHFLLRQSSHTLAVHTLVKDAPKIFHWGKTEGPKIDAELPKAESGGGVPREGQQTPSPPARRSGRAL